MGMEEEWKKDLAEHQRKKAKMNPQSEEDSRRQEPQYQVISKRFKMCRAVAPKATP